MPNKFGICYNNNIIIALYGKMWYKYLVIILLKISLFSWPMELINNYSNFPCLYLFNDFGNNEKEIIKNNYDYISLPNLIHHPILLETTLASPIWSTNESSNLNFFFPLFIKRWCINDFTNIVPDKQFTKKFIKFLLVLLVHPSDIIEQPYLPQDSLWLLSNSFV